MRHSSWLFLAIAFLLLPAGALATPLSIKERAHSLTDEDSCKAAGGHWEGSSHALGKLSGCNLPTSDSGKACRDSRECEGYCVRAEQRALGDAQCTAWTQFKCCGVVTNESGKSHLLCID